MSKNSVTTNNKCNLVTNSPNIRYAIADSGCTSHYISLNTPHSNTHQSPPLKVTLPNGQQITSSQSCVLPLPALPLPAKTANIFPAMNNKALLSLGKFCDHNYIVTLTKDKIMIQNKDDLNLSLQGHRDFSTGMWLIDLKGHSQSGRPPTAAAAGSIPSSSSCDPLPQPTQPQTHTALPQTHNLNSAYELSRKADLVLFLHKCCFCPTKATWIKAIRAGYFIS